MALGRRELSAIVLAVGALLFYVVFLLSAQSGAQTADNGQGDEGCSNPQPIETFSGTENQRTPQFQITGDAFRLTFDVVEVTDPNGFPSLEADVLNAQGQPIGQGFITFEEDGSENILAGPGTFSLEIRASDVRYEIVVEDCIGTNQDGEVIVDDGVTIDDNIQEDVFVEVTRDRKPIKKQPTIINIPDKPLPPSGGPPVYGVVASFILAGTGLLALGIGIRRGLRR